MKGLSERRPEDRARGRSMRLVTSFPESGEKSMTSFSTTRRCRTLFRKGSLGADSVQRPFDLHRALLILIFIALQLSGSRSEAKPSVIAGVQFTDRFAPNSL